MPGRFIPADHDKGDANTIGGYIAVHARPAAFEGSDGMSYSVELCVDKTGDPVRPYGAYILFLRWRRVGPQGVEGHLESEFLAWGNDKDEARDLLGTLSLNDVRDVLERLIVGRRVGTGAERRWWDVMRDEPTE